jgi:hypothetical protein
MRDVLRDDETVLYRLWVSHTTFHQCGSDCPARKIIEDARAAMEKLA